jgi:NhaP-type Na+/H+ or K+/H+ antiporter
LEFFFLFPSAFFKGRTVAEIELVCLLLMVVAAFDIVARKVGLPYPVLLVLSGLVLSLVPYLPHVALDPELALLVFLPPLLYRAAFFTSWRDFRRTCVLLRSSPLTRADNNGRWPGLRIR